MRAYIARAYIALDVGGTSISAAVVSDDGRLLTDVTDYKAHSSLASTEIFDNIALIISEQYDKAKTQKLDVCGTGIAFPGPFDYENGISLMRGIGKFDSIYGMNIRDEMQKRLSFKTEIKFCNDADLYTIGECTFGMGKPYNRCMCVCIGTGVGSGFFAGGEIVQEGKGVPPNGWIYDTPYRDGIADMYLSGTWLKNEMSRHPELSKLQNVKELADSARNGNLAAQKIFETFGNMLCDVLIPYAVNFNADCLILGGNVSRSSHLFDSELRSKLSERNISVHSSTAFANNTLLACAKLFN